MRIKQFCIKNFRNLRYAECIDPPEFTVICGGNGCGKTALLEALMTAKEHAGRTKGFTFDPRAVAADANQATIAMTLEFADNERAFVKDHWKEDCPEQDEIIIEILRGGQAKAVKRSDATNKLLSYYSRESLQSPGFFDYIDAFRHAPKVTLNSWSTEFLSDEQTRFTLGAPGSQKFQHTKRYLAGLKMRHVQELKQVINEGRSRPADSLQEISEFFNNFFAPMRLVDVKIHTFPFEFIVETPRGAIDIDDLSGGEKEVLNVFVRFHQMKPQGAVILFDEPDAHLHPDLERRYLETLRTLGQGNQLWLTTHSPEMMIGAGTDALYTVLKEPLSNDGNQFVRVTDDETMHATLCELMGSRGLVSFNQRIVFIEGEESSADREVYEKLYPPGAFNVSFVPAGNSATVRSIAERVNCLLSSSMTFQDYYSIVDGDIERPDAQTASSKRLYTLPVYHVENFLLDAGLILEVTKNLLASDCPYTSSTEVDQKLCELIVADAHVKPYTAALWDARIARLVQDVSDDLYQSKARTTSPLAVPRFEDIKKEATTTLQAAIRDNTWRARCKGREVLRAFAGQHSLNYKHFRNCIIAKIKRPPDGLARIMSEILGESPRP